MEQIKIIFTCIIIEIMLILCVGCANLHQDPIAYFLFYHVLYGMVFGFLIPVFLLRKERNVFDSIGIYAFGKRQTIILVLFVAFSVGGQLTPRIVSGEIIPWKLLPMGVVPLIMTTFFEEFFFRGFIQNRFEKNFGTLPAILVSGLTFSLYHLGYPGFRTVGDILLLLAVGIGFAAAYKLSGNNLIVAYFVNLPNAFVTYMLKYEQFPIMEFSSTITGTITICILIAVFILLRGARQKNSDER